MYGDLVSVAPNALMVEGQRPWNILFAPDVANAVLYRRSDTLYILDTGATLFFRRRIIEAAERLRPFRRIVLLNSHGHVDHTSNNSVIHDIQADEKLHFITEVGIDGLDYDRYFRRQFGQINRYYNFLDGPSFPFSLMGTLLKVLARFNPEAQFLLVGSLLSKFPPMESLATTVVPFERRGPAQRFRFGSEEWTGWNIEDAVYALESRGHGPDHVIFYIPEEKLAFLGDEAFDFFNVWPDSHAGRVRTALNKAINMASHGSIEVVVSCHHPEMPRGAAIVEFLSAKLRNWDAFQRDVGRIVGDSASGVTVHDIYGRLKSGEHSPAVDAFFSMEFPKMPPLLKTVIALMLVENGSETTSVHGATRFLNRTNLVM